jgi:hypothetical protein
MATDGPSFIVEKKDGKFEIRNYDDHILAEVEVFTDYDAAWMDGFEILSGYIFGNNISRSKIPMTSPVSQENKSEKISMTAPVSSEPSEERKSEKIPMTAPVASEVTSQNIYRISFVMPKKYTIETLPLAVDKNIKFRKVNGYRAAVIRFHGYINENMAIEKIKELKKWLKENNLEPKSNFVSAQYDSPWIPAPFRRNEIIVKI